jgi:hypothetical protein
MAGCSKSTTAAATDDSAALVDTFSVGSVAWSISPDGQARAWVKTPDGKQVTENVNGTTVWKTASGPKTVVLNQDKQSGALSAAGPKLDSELTEVDYTVNVSEKPMNGTLFLPRGGTSELVATAKAPPAVVVADGKKGPHGGPIQVVGKDRLEIVASQKGEVRVYVLDDNLQPVVVGKRTIQLGVGGSSPEVVVLTPAPTGLYFVGHWKANGEPERITLEERDGDDVRVVVVGHKPGSPLVIVVGTAAPVVTVAEFDRDREHGDDDDQGEHGEHGDHGGRGGRHGGKDK